MYLCMCVSVNIKRPVFFYDRPYSSSSISNFSNSAVCNTATIASTELCELVFIHLISLLSSQIAIESTCYLTMLSFHLDNLSECHLVIHGSPLYQNISLTGL